MENQNPLPQLPGLSLLDSKIFGDVPPDLKTQVLSESEVLDFRKKQLVFEQEEPATAMYIVISGVFKLFHLTDGVHCTIHDIVTRDELVGGLLMQRPECTYPVSMECLQAGSVLSIPKKTYDEHWANNPVMLRKLQNMNYERMSSIQKLRELQKFPIERRLRIACLEFLRKLATDDKYLVLPMTRTDLADIVGSSQETIIRMLTKWRERGIVGDFNGEERIDLEKLKAFENA